MTNLLCGIKVVFVLPFVVTHYERKMIYMMIVPRRNRSFDLFDDFFKEDDFFTRKESSLMKTDIKEKKDKYVIEVDLPGCKKENINLELNNGYLEISAKVIKENNSNSDEKYLRQERFYGECSRSFYVGEQVTQTDVSAEFVDGILKIEVPKIEEVEEEPEVKRIEIK